jgi:enoyl-CoA hydratase
MACHVRFASTNALFGQPEVKLGIIPGYGGSQRLPRLVGMGRALELVLSGEMIDAEEAWRIGLVNQVVKPEILMDTAQKFCQQVLGNSPLALRYAIDTILEGQDIPFREAMLFEASSFGICASSEDMKEGTSAFLEKRKANFKGK